jgi:hypothetical protein
MMIAFTLFAVVFSAHFVLGASLSCSVTTSGACSDTIVMYLQNDTGGDVNAHAQNASVASYANVVCCAPTGDTLSLTCSDQIYGRLSSVDNAHFEQNNQDIYSVEQCLSASTHRVVCGYSTTGCGAFDTCLFSYASSDGANVTNSHVATCAEYTADVCCTLNDRPVLASALLNATSVFNLSDDNLTLQLGSVTDDESDATRTIVDWQVDGDTIAFVNYPFDVDNAYTSITDEENFGSTTDGFFGPTTDDKPAFVSSCIVGGCYNFSGQEYIFTGFASAQDEANDISFAFWMRTTADDVDIYSRGNGFQGSQIRIRHNDTLEVHRTTNILSTNVTVNDGNWHHIFINYDSSANDLDVYVNGSESFSGTLSGIGVGGAPCEIIGANTSDCGTVSLDHAYEGELDEFYIFDRLLTAEQISSLYTQQAAGSDWTILHSSMTSYAQNWSAVATPTDGYQYGASVSSNSLFINGGDLLVEHENSFINFTTAHAFNVTAGFSYSTGADNIFNVSISSSAGACTNIANSTNGIYFNATFNCTGTPYVSSTISITACDAFSTCVSTTPSANAYPNQAPVMKNLLLPADGNDSLTNRLVNFTWEESTDAENDPFNYTINVTNAFCQDRTATDIVAENYQFASELNTSFECANNPYFWQVRVCDSWDCSNYTTAYNFSIVDYLNILIVNNEINFSNTDLNSADNTSDDSPLPFTFENDGNIHADLQAIQSTGLWAAVGLNTSFYQHSIDNSSEANSFDWLGSTTAWLNITSNGWAATLVDALDYNDSSDSVEVEILIQVPPAEPPGAKTDTLTFVWGSS